MRRSKYNAVPQQVDGIYFPSTKEARRYQELRLLEKAKQISCLAVHRPFYDLVVNGQKVGRYVPDFTYWENGAKAMTVEDSKGVRTQVYLLKKKLMLAIYGIEVKET